MSSTATYKTENQVWKEIITIVSQWLTAQGFKTWYVRQGHQPQIVDIDTRLILVDRITSTRYGWQADKSYYNEVGDKMENHIRYLTDMTFQLSFIKRRNTQTDNINTLTSSDMANNLLTYFMSAEGLSTFRKLGYGLLRTTSLREPIFSDEDDNYERYPNFDITLNFPQIKVSEIGYIKSAEDVIGTNFSNY